MEIENEGLFRNALMHGINLFLGAGFSLSAYSLSKDGRQQIPLPKGDKLRDELVEHFNLGHFSKLNLPQLSQVLTTQFREEFYSYLTRCFTVSSFHPSYKNLYRTKIDKIFTTNIDNLIHKVFEDNNMCFIHDVDVHGANTIDISAISYYALHGSVINGKECIFTPTEIASAFSGNQDNWHLFRREVKSKDTLFWGYNLDDADV
jgi:hypothetical protein